MKTNKLIVPILTGVLFAAVAHAQEDITVTGSTACRKIIYDRAATLFDAGYTTQGGALAYGNGASQITAVGTMSNAVPALGSTVVRLRFGMSGAAQGLVDLDQQNPIATKDPITGNASNTIPDISFADTWPAAVPVNVPDADLTTDVKLCVLPFVFFKNPTSPGMATVSNITKEQSVMLLSSSGTLPNGTPAMPASFLGGTGTNAVYLIGRDNGSGTRLGVFKDTGFTGTPRQWATNASGQLVLAQTLAGVSGSGIPQYDINGSAGGIAADGYSSGGTVAKTVNGLTTYNVIGYAGEPDASSITGTNNWLSFQGAFCTHSNVANGYYPIWCYEHIYARKNSNPLNANKQLVFNALTAAITNATWQATDNTVFRPNAVALNEMVVKRGVDGGPFTTTPAAGW